LQKGKYKGGGERERLDHGAGNGGGEGKIFSKVQPWGGIDMKGGKKDIVLSYGGCRIGRRRTHITGETQVRWADAGPIKKKTK